ncbi:helix-turn-helix transcriptional regulator [Candidatus Omnitrophota bacterium]
MITRNIRLIVARHRKGYKQWELAKEVGIHHKEYSKFESRNEKPSDEIQHRIAMKLGAKKEDLF